MEAIGKYLGDGKIELNDYGLSLILQHIKPNETISEKELLKRVNKTLIKLKEVK